MLVSKRCDMSLQRCSSAANMAGFALAVWSCAGAYMHARCMHAVTQHLACSGGDAWCMPWQMRIRRTLGLQLKLLCTSAHLS